MTRPLARTAAKRLRRFLAQRLSVEDFARADDMLDLALAWAYVKGENWSTDHPARDEVPA